MITLYHYPDCPYSQKVRVVMAEKDLEYERVLVDLRKNEQRAPEFLKLNPYGRVPVLIDEDVVIYDSTIINEYLEEEYPAPNLMPEDSAGRARVRLLEDFCDNSFIPPTLIILSELARPQAERDNEKLRRFQGEIGRVLAHLDAQLDGRQFLGGADFCLADCGFAPRLMILPQLGIEIDPRLSNVSGWIGRLHERASVRSLGL
jgi:glutathione S-transferase